MPHSVYALLSEVITLVALTWFLSVLSFLKCSNLMIVIQYLSLLLALCFLSLRTVKYLLVKSNKQNRLVSGTKQPFLRKNEVTCELPFVSGIKYLWPNFFGKFRIKSFNAGHKKENKTFFVRSLQWKTKIFFDSSS